MNTVCKYNSTRSYRLLDEAYSKIRKISVSAVRFVRNGAYIEKGAEFIALAFEFLCSKKFISCAKPTLSVAILAGIIGIISGSAAAPFVLVFSCVFLSLVLFLEYVLDSENGKYEFN